MNSSFHQFEEKIKFELGQWSFTMNNPSNLILDEDTATSLLIVLVVTVTLIFCLCIVSCLKSNKKQNTDASESDLESLIKSGDSHTHKKINNPSQNFSVNFLDNPEATNMMRNKFVDAFSRGISLTLHTLGKGTKTINMELANDYEIHWKTAKFAPKKRKCLHLKDVKSVCFGKKTPTFQQDASNAAPQECCFSLIASDNSTVDLQLRSKSERDNLVQGILILINEYKRGHYFADYF